MIVDTAALSREGQIEIVPFINRNMQTKNSIHSKSVPRIEGGLCPLVDCYQLMNLMRISYSRHTHLTRIVVCGALKGQTYGPSVLRSFIRLAVQTIRTALIYLRTNYHDTGDVFHYNVITESKYNVIASRFRLKETLLLIGHIFLLDICTTATLR